MLCKRLGGIQQVFLDYNQALTMQGNKVINIAHPKSETIKKLQAEKAELRTVANFNQYDFLAIRKLRKIITNEKPDIIIVHGNRAAEISRKARSKATIYAPIAAVCHNKRIERLIGLDALIIILESLRKYVLELGQPPKTTYYVPNMIHAAPEIEFKRRKFHKKIIIGTMGRFVEEKAFEVFIQALNILKKKKIPFKAILAGRGELESFYKAQIKSLGLEKDIKMQEWVTNKGTFFNKIDIFCMSSRIEHFSIAMLETMLSGTPIVATDADGPREVIRHKINGIIVKKDNPKALAEGLEHAMNHPKAMRDYAMNSFDKVLKSYSIDAVSNQLHEYLSKIAITANKKTNAKIS